MLTNPEKELIVISFAGSDGKDDIDQFLLVILERDAVQLEKNEHGMSSGTLVPIDEGMVLDNAEGESCGFSMDTEIERAAGESLERCTDSGFQQAVISDTVRAAKSIDEMFV